MDVVVNIQCLLISLALGLVVYFMVGLVQFG